MRLQRVRDAGNRTEMQFDKWTTEGAVKSSSLESILQRNICVIDEECVGILLEITGVFSVKQGGTAGLYTCPCKRTGVLFFKLGDGYLFCEHMRIQQLF